MSFDEKLWVLDESETFALSGWLTQAAPVDREAIGVHGGTYAEELVASIVRSRVHQEFGREVEIHQNRWDKTAKREADISLLRKERLAAGIEIKSALTKEEWNKIGTISLIRQAIGCSPSVPTHSMRLWRMSRMRTLVAACCRKRAEKCSNSRNTNSRCGSRSNPGSIA